MAAVDRWKYVCVVMFRIVRLHQPIDPRQPSTNMYTYINIYTYICIHIYVYIYMYTNIYKYHYVCAVTLLLFHLHQPIDLYVCVFVSVCRCVCVVTWKILGTPLTDFYVWHETQGSVVDIRSSFADIWGSFADIWGSFANTQDFCA